mmetsp:Transcript_15523/g.23699  ORF Transcript_15523/g.23699 Transcript_15523/m.23699 type:complete len:92 (-) Transcript_15523:370-645(-)
MQARTAANYVTETLVHESHSEGCTDVQPLLLYLQHHALSVSDQVFDVSQSKTSSEPSLPSSQPMFLFLQHHVFSLVLHACGDAAHVKVTSK